MLSYYFQFLTVCIIFLGVIQEGKLIPSPTGNNNNEHLNQMVDIGVLLNRLDEMEAKVNHCEAKVAEHEDMVSIVNQHELKINRQQEEIDQLKKKNEELEKKKNQVNKADDNVTSRDFLPRSCFEIKATNPTAQSGIYSIDPDGQIGVDQPINVYCDMTTQTTSIYHDSEVKTNVPSCPDPGCYTKAITYSATMRQMMNLADISASCKQYIRFDSLSVPLEYNSTQFGYWNDRNGGKQIFWAGPATSQHTCQCGIMNNCVERTFKCNSDSLAPIELVDEGFVTATELLPVTRLSFGRTSLNGVKASYTLGRFECTGQAPTSSKPSNCRDLFKMGHILSGFYNVKGSSNQIASTYCDFSKASTEVDYETRYGFVDIQSSPVHFYVIRHSGWSTLNATMPFEKEHLNLGGGMNLTSGVFTAPKAGIYTFSFSGTAGVNDANSTGQAEVQLNRNGIPVATSHNHVNGVPAFTHLTAPVHGTLKLNVGDQITIMFTSGGIIGNTNGYQWNQFLGSLLEEDLIIS